MNKKKITSVVVPVALILSGIFSYLTIKHNWNFEMASYSIFVFVSSYILIFERIIPLKQAWKPQKKTLWIDIKHFILSVAIVDALGKMVALFVVLYLQEHYFESFKIWDALPLLIVYGIANVIGEFLPYLYHLISHKGKENSFVSQFLWKVHAIHHLPIRLNWFKTNWVHPINMFLNTVLKMTPILFLGFGKEIVFLVGVTHIVVAYISHANIQTKKSVLDYVIVTPQIHHFHHSIKMNEAKNFGNTIPFWDLIFGTYYNRKGSVEKVGVVTDSSAKYPSRKSYKEQLIFPLTKADDCCK